MESNELAKFSIRILAADNGTWQGLVETDQASYYFKSEMQLLKWLCSQYPALMP